MIFPVSFSLLFLRNSRRLAKLRLQRFKKLLKKILLSEVRKFENNSHV